MDRGKPESQALMNFLMIHIPSSHVFPTFVIYSSEVGRERRRERICSPFSLF